MKRVLIAGATLLTMTSAGAVAFAAEPRPKARPKASRTDPAVENNQAETYVLLQKYLASQRAYAALKKRFADSFTAGKEKKSEPRLSAAQKKKVLKLVSELGSSSYSTRESASKQLGRFGREALPVFESAKAGTKDPEVSTRLEALIRDLQPRFRKKGPVQLLGTATKGIPLPWYQVDRKFADAVEKCGKLHGYRFRRLKLNAAGKPLGSKLHAIVAFPSEPGRSGKKSFIAVDDLRGSYWQVLAREAARPDFKSLPADLEGKGWKRVDPVPGSVKKRPPGARETNVVGSCRAYCSAQTMFKRNDWDGNGVLEYAPNFGMLYTTPDGNGDAINLIDKRMKNATSPKTAKHGYFFVDMKTIAGKAIDWVNDYGICAVPASYGKTGRRTFIVCTNGTVFGKDTGGQPVFDYPANPPGAGWVIAE